MRLFFAFFDVGIFFFKNRTQGVFTTLILAVAIGDFLSVGATFDPEIRAEWVRE